VFNRLFLHNANGLIGSLVIALAVTAVWPLPGLCAVALGWLVHMLCDIFWDFKHVGHARNWFARGGLPWRPDGRLALSLSRSWYMCWAVIIGAVGMVGLRLAAELRAGAQLPPASVLGYLTAVGVILEASLLLGLATAVWRQSASLRAATGVRPALTVHWPGSPSLGWAASRRLSAARVFRHDHLVLSACLAVAMPGLLILWTFLAPGMFLQQHQVPADVLALPLGLMICTGVFGHTTAGAVGGLLGTVLSVAGERLLAMAGAIHAWAPPTAFGVVVSGLAAWAFSLLLGRWSGRVQASSTLIAISAPAGPAGSTLTPAPDDEAGRDIDELRMIFEQACQQAFGGKIAIARPTWPQPDDADHWGVTSRREVLVFADRVRIRFRASYSPLAREDDAVFHETFCPASIGPVPLMPRYWAGTNAPHAQAHSGRLRWRGSYDRAAMATTRPDGITLHKTLSEITDNLLTRRTEVIVDVCRLRGGSGGSYAVIARERTSTKIYTTPESEHVGLLMADYIAGQTGGRAAGGRIVSSAYSGEHPLGFAGPWTPAIASAGQELELAQAATLLNQDFQSQTTRLIAQRLLFGIVQIAGLLPIIQLVARP